MKGIGCLLLGFIICTLSFSQNMLVLEKSNMRKNFKYYEGDHIAIGIKGDSLITGTLTACYDSLIIIDNIFRLSISDIKFIKGSRGAFGFFSELFYKAGIPYFIITTINRSVNHDQPVFTNSNLIISSSLIAAAVLSHIFATKRYQINKGKWKLKVLEM